MSDAVTALVEKFVTDLRKVLREEMVQTLLGAEAPASASPRIAKASTPKIVRAPGKRTPEMISEQAKAILGFLKRNPSSSAQQIAEGIGVELKELGLPIQKLKDDKALKVVGVRRGTKYSAK